MNSVKAGLAPIQKSMARHMAESWDGVPQFSVEGEVDCQPLSDFRKGLEFKTSYTTLIVKAVAMSVSLHPEVNVSFGGDHILKHGEINIGVAADTKKGLLVPVIHRADEKSLHELHECMEIIKERAARGSFTLEQLSNGTFTVSNLGMFQVSAFTAIVNAPQAAIMALSQVRDVPVVRDGAVVPGKRMRVCVSGDHRVVAGADLARFLIMQESKRLR